MSNGKPPLLLPKSTTDAQFILAVIYAAGDFFFAILGLAGSVYLIYNGRAVGVFLAFVGANFANVRRFGSVARKWLDQAESD